MAVDTHPQVEQQRSFPTGLSRRSRRCGRHHRFGQGILGNQLSTSTVEGLAAVTLDLLARGRHSATKGGDSADRGRPLHHAPNVPAPRHDAETEHEHEGADPPAAGALAKDGRR